MKHSIQNFARVLFLTAVWQLAAAALVAQDSTAASAGGAVFPATQWQRRSPSEVAMDEGKLKGFRHIVGGRGCTVCHGYLGYSWGEYDKPHDVASALKPLYSYLLMQALAHQKLTSLDTRVADTIFPVRSIGGPGNQCDHQGGYSWMWWLTRTARDGKLWFPDVPDNFYACFGHGGQEGMAVLPGQDMVVSWIGNELHQNRDRGNQAFRTLVAAVTD